MTEDERFIDKMRESSDKIIKLFEENKIMTGDGVGGMVFTLALVSLQADDGAKEAIKTIIKMLRDTQKVLIEAKKINDKI